jgi:hypothetical protein
MMLRTPLFFNFLYMSIQIFIILSAIFVKNWLKNWNFHGQNYSFYQYKHEFSCYFHDFGEKNCLYHLSLRSLSRKGSYSYQIWCDTEFRVEVFFFFFLGLIQLLSTFLYYKQGSYGPTQEKFINREQLCLKCSA